MHAEHIAIRVLFNVSDHIWRWSGLQKSLYQWVILSFLGKGTQQGCSPSPYLLNIIQFVRFAHLLHITLRHYFSFIFSKDNLISSFGILEQESLVANNNKNFLN